MIRQEKRQRTIRQGREAELFLEGARVLNVYSGEVLKSNVAVKGEMVWYPFHDPLYTFVFLPKDFLPEVRINRKGVVNITKDEVLWPARMLDS